LIYYYETQAIIIIQRVFFDKYSMKSSDLRVNVRAGWV